MLSRLAALSVFALTLSAQRNVPPEFMYHRVYAVLPMVGAGTKADPKRPMLIPTVPSATAVPQVNAGERPDLLGYQMQISDDGKWALVEMVFQSPLSYQRFLGEAAATPGVLSIPVALQAIPADGSSVSAVASNTAKLKAAFEASVPGLRLFERGQSTQQQIVTEFQKHKASYVFGSSSVRP